MANRRSALRLSGCLLGGMLLLLAAGRGLKAETRLFSFSTSKGLAVKVLQDNDLPFVHAQLLIYLDGNVQNYSSLAIAQLAVMNMFERSLNSPPSNLMDMLQRQGNDFQVEQNPEYVKISMNFLPDRLASFSKLLKEIFTYQSFHLNKFNRSKENFWPLFMRGRDWKKEIAQLLAYQQLTGNFYFSQGFLLQDILNGINMAQLRSFLLRTFRPDNALLILKGKINPYFILGMIEKDLPQPPARQARPRKEDAPLNVGRKIFILNVNSPELPMVYWFDTAPPAGDPAYLPFAIGNHSLFGFPGGRIYQSERNQFMMGGYKVNSEAVFLKDFTMFCNSLRLNYNDLENFLLLVEQERKRFAIRPIERKEYLDALNYYVGKAMVETSRYDHGLQAEIDRFTERGTPPPPRPGPELFQEVSFGRVQQALDEQMGSRHKSGSREKGIVVLVGNANLIVNSLRLLKTEALELSMD
ncbi:MAG: insulinase family protein [Acidobacteria bacterium]|jgi:predicted Zn-dependent peptidase|nr:insulinase family protein [Acidobacteriota bacterium]